MIVAEAEPARVAADGDGADALRVGGFVPFTATDYPGELAAVVFCQGCPWRCGYCHNPHLLPAQRADGALAWDTVLAFLEGRRGLLDGVVFSGGEPTAQAALVPAIAAVKDLGFRVALHTAGIYPRRLAEILPSLDWVGLDLKAPGAEYERITGVRESDGPAFQSLDLLVRSGVALEVRTTVHPALTDASSLQALATELGRRGVETWVLQPFRPVGCADASLVRETSAPIPAHVLDRVRATFPHVEVR